MADAENRLQNAVTDMMRRLNVSRLRPIQKQTYLNMAACLDKHPQDAQAQQCLDQTQAGIKLAHNMIQNEVNQFSERVQRCVRDCQDGVRDRFGELNQDNLSKAQEYMDKCSNACVDKHVAMLKNIESRLEKDIADKTKGLV